MNYANLDKTQLVAIYSKAMEAVLAGEKAGLGEKHPLMRARFRVLGAVSAALASK